MPEWLPAALAGLAFGLLVSGINYLILKQGMEKASNLPPKKGGNYIFSRYGIRIFLDLAALLLVHRNTPMLIGTAIGLTVTKNIMFIKHFIWQSGKKGVS